MVSTIEHGFSLFSDDEIIVGLQYAAKTDYITLDHARLRRLANNAGKTRINAGGKLTPRTAAARAIQSFEREFPGSKLKPQAFEGYVHAIAKMMSERSPNTSAKRRQQAEAQEILATSYKIDETPLMDLEINKQLQLGMTGDLFEDTADVP